MAERGVVLHLPEDWVSDPDRMMPFYQRLIEGLDARGVAHRLEAIDRAAALARVEADPWFHIYNHGRVVHPRALNAGVAYVYPYWHLDPQGIRAFSSIGDKRFRPALVDEAKARAFFGRLRARMVEARVSRYEQPEAPERVPEGCAAVFFQSEAHRGVGETCYMDRWTMLETVLGAWPGPVVVKPHPRELDSDMFARLLEMAGAEARLTVSQANIHDILAACDRVVTINSAVGLEAYLHRKPVVLCGRADFHHVADVAESATALAEHLRAPARGRLFAKYIYWYFAWQCVDAGARDVAGQVLRRIEKRGYALD